MDGSTLEHSDSDSGESWTLLENSPADDAPDSAEHPNPEEGMPADNAEKDDDTDGISIISDSEPESSAPCELTYEEICPPEPQLPDFISVNPVPPNRHETHESIKDEEDFLGDNNGKLKTYVHKRNKRLSTMLNIIMLGSVITAAGVAFGHMWGARCECPVGSVPSVNKILSNLYKLQEENTFLRNRVKELTLYNNIHQLQQRKSVTGQSPPQKLLKQHKCKKVFEESLTNKNADGLTKCVDNENEELDKSKMLEFEKEFLDDIEKLRSVYHENKSWLDEEIARRMKRPFVNTIKIKNSRLPKSINMELKTIRKESIEGETVKKPPLNIEDINMTEPLTQIIEPQEKKITYADSLKSVHKVVKRDAKLGHDKAKIREYVKKRKPPKEHDTTSVGSSDEELRKDDRYVPHLYKLERIKNDRHKTHKKQKRRNKYEQWEMKGGYMKDYDDSSIPSSNENEHGLNNADIPRKETERNNYITQLFESGANKKVEVKTRGEKGERDNLSGNETKGKEASWYEKRVALRSAARRRLEQEMFSEAPPSAQWYFRRVQRRELCRNNHTKRRSKDNYKTRH